MTASGIKDKARQMGACDMIDGVETLDGLLAVACTPQGREFCKKHGFPTIGMLRDADAEVLKASNWFVDAGDIELSDADNVVVAGDTRATLKYSATDRPYHATVMHGAKANILAGGYAVLQVTNIGGDVAAFTGSHARVVIR